MRPLRPKEEVTAEDYDAQQDQYQRESTGRRDVERDVEFSEDLGREGLVAENLEGAELGQNHEADEDTAAKDRPPGLGERDPKEGLHPAEAETPRHFLESRVRATKTRSDGQVDEGIDRERHHEDRSLKAVDPRPERGPTEAHHEVGNREGQDHQHRPHVSTGQVRSLHEEGQPRADDGAEHGDDHVEAHGVPQQCRREGTKDEVRHGTNAGAARFNEEKDQGR